jgi:dihydropteroate synthase
MTTAAEATSTADANTLDRLVRHLADPTVLVCGIVNATPDSFFDGGRYQGPSRAVDHAHTLIIEGADMLDVGGESTRPGSHPPSVAEEIARVIPVIETLARTTSVPISVDTSRPEVMREAVAAGAVMINDVRALRLAGALETAAALHVPVCLMHMQGVPPTMQVAPAYDDVVAEVRGFLLTRVGACLNAGIPMDDLVVDPGFGFGKTLEHNLELLAALPRIVELGLPVMAPAVT